MLAQIDESDQEDSPEPEVESDGSDIEVVVSDDESEDLEDEESSDLENFIASSSSGSDDDGEDNASDDEEYSSDKYDKVDNEEGSCKDLEDDEAAELSA